MFIRKLLAVIIVVLIAIPILPVSAHPSSQEGILQKEYISDPDYNDYYIGGEGTGWFIDEACHSANNSITYKLAAGLSSPIKAVINDGVDLWNNASDSHISFTKASDGIGIIQTANLGSGIKAVFQSLSVNSSTGHLTSWRIRINEVYINSINSLTIAHELGHAIGLTDLYSTTNKNKLMYNTSNGRTATGPHQRDLLGAEVITGTHTSHSWQYVFYYTNSGGQNYHRRKCSYCKGIKYNSVEACTYSGGVCTKCGIPQGYSPSGIGLPTATAILPDPYGEERKSYALLI